MPEESPQETNSSISSAAPLPLPLPRPLPLPHTITTTRTAPLTTRPLAPVCSTDRRPLCHATNPRSRERDAWKTKSDGCFCCYCRWNRSGSLSITALALALKVSPAQKKACSVPRGLDYPPRGQSEWITSPPRTGRRKQARKHTSVARILTARAKEFGT